MDKKYFAIKLIPSRPTFAQDMTPDERAIMMQHVSYWREFLDEGKLLVYGPVMDPKGAYGFGVMIAENEDEVKAFIAADPSGSINTFEFYPMRAVVKE